MFPWILAAGAFNLALAIFHLSFWQLFGWPKTLAPGGAVNSRITQILNLAIAYLFVLAGLLCLLFPADMAASAVGNFWLASMAGFWLARAVIQPVFFGLRHPMSVVLFGVFILGAMVHGMSWATARGIGF